MLVRADPGLETVTMLSFPRDLLVEIQGCPNGTFVCEDQQRVWRVWIVRPRSRPCGS